MGINNKVWLVTEASKGFGLALVKLLLSSGFKVAATGNIEMLKRQAGGAGKNFLPLKVNIANDGEVKNALKQIVKKFGRLDVVVNNAGYAMYGSL